MEKEIVLIDCDPGIDDAYALLYAMADKTLDIRLISSVSGNVSVDVNTINAQRIVKMAKKDIPVVKGSRQPLVKVAQYAEHVHGKNGMNDYVYKNDEMVELLDKPFLQAYYETIIKAKKPVIIAAVGPLTNIATLLLAYPEIKSKIKYISVMGGGLKGGNVTVAAEFNFYVDPEAAHIVMNSGVDIVMAGLDVTEKTVVSSELLEELRSLNYIGQFLYDILRPDSAYMIRDKGSLHDVVALMAISNLDIFKYKEYDVYVDVSDGLSRGMTIADLRMNSEGKAVKVLLDVDVEKFNQLLISKIAKY